MRKPLCNLVLYLICILFSLSLWGQKRVDIAQAEKVAENIASSFTSGKARAIKPKLNLVHTSTKSGNNKFKTLTTNDEVYYYVFNVETDKGFVVVSGNDITIPVLGYSNEGGYNEKDIPPALAWWMEQYKQEIQYALDHKVTQDTETKAKWAEFTDGASQSVSSKIENRSTYKQGTYLVESEWNTGEPFNKLILEKYLDYRSIAIAQLMYYWKYPAEVLTPIPSYTFSGNDGPIYVPEIATGTPIDWPNIKASYNGNSSYNPIQVKAVAELVYYIENSSVTTWDEGGILKKYFGYNAEINKVFKDQNIANWDAILKTQIDAFQPMLYEGVSNYGHRHNFICDGYQYQNGTPYFHFRWGGSGGGHAYFAINEIINNSNNTHINSNHSAFINIKPESTVCSSPLNLSTSSITRNSASLNWDLINGIPSYTVEYKASASETWIPVDKAVTTNSYKLSGLTTNTAYNWRLKANCSFGSSSEYTKQINFSTENIISCNNNYEPNDTKLKASNIELNKIYYAAIESTKDKDFYKFTLNSFSNVEIVLESLPKNYLVTVYKPDGFTPILEWRESDTNDTNNSAYLPLFIKYMPAETYYISISSQNRDPNWCYNVKVNVLETDLCLTPRFLDIENVIHNSADLSWDLEMKEKSFTIEYKPLTSTIWSPPITAYTHSHTLSKLEPGTTYNVKMKTNCFNGNSSEYITTNFTTETNINSCPAPLYASSNHMTTNSAGLYWNTVSSAKNYTVEYKPSSSTWDSYSSITANTSPHELSYSGLMANTDYDWRVKANCYNGNSSEYVLGRFKTPTITTVCSISSYEPNNSRTKAPLIDINMNHNAVIGSSTDQDFYKFVLSYPSDIVVTLGNLPKNYDLKLMNSAGTQIGLLGNKTGTADEIISLNAQPAGTYYVQVYGVNRAYDRNQCYVLRVSTISTVVCNPPTVLLPASITSSTADLKWNVVSRAQSYTVEYKLSTASWTSATTTTIATTNRSLLGLTADTTYDWRIKANCSGSSSSGYTYGTSFKTLAATVVCNPPTVLLPASITSSTADLKWNVVSGAQSYTVEYKLSTASWTSATPITIATTSRSLLGLTADTTYDWRIKANCSGSSSSGYTDGTSFKTLAATVVCNPPTVLPPANITSSTADLKWNVVSGAQSYTVEYKLSTASWASAITTTITNTSRSLLGLTADTTYDWRIKANCSSSSSSGYTYGTSFKTLAATVVCNPGLYEPNNTRKAASLIDLNTTYKAGIQVTLDRDYYKFILSAPSNVVITLENVPENYTFQLLNYLGSYIDSGFMSGNGKTIKRALARGTYYINITAFSRDYDASQCYALRINTPSGSSSPSSNETVVNDKNTILSSNVTLYPNPVDDMINIKGLVSDQEYTQLTIIDRNGGIVKISQVKVEDIIRVDVSDLSPNIYHLTILGKNFRFIKK